MAEYVKNEVMDWARENVRGQWTTVMTPFDENDQIDELALRHNIRHIRSLGTRGGGFSWNMGEFWSLTREERIQLFEIASDEANGEWPIAAQVTHTSVKEMLKLADSAEALGFDMLIVGAPYMVTKTNDQVIDFVKILAEYSNLGIMFYNTPQFGIVLDADALGKICDIPNVVGVKEASFNPEISIESHQKIGSRAIISTPDEWILFKGKELGFEQQVMFANTSDWRFDLPGSSSYVKFIDKAMTGVLDQDFYDKNIKPIKSVSDKWWAYTVNKMNGVLQVAMCKFWCEVMGLKHGHVRAPISELSDEEKDQLKTEIKSILG